MYLSLGLILAIIIIINWSIKRARLRHARKIFAKFLEDGPESLSLENYMFLFPGACEWCGSREFLLIEWETQGTMDEEPEWKTCKGRYAKCARPGCTWWKAGSWVMNLEGGRKDKVIKRFRVGSLYLTEEEAAKIPEIKYHDTTEWIKHKYRYALGS